MIPADKNYRDLLRIIVGGSALAFGTLSAFLASFSEFRANGSIELSWKPVLGFILGFAATVAFWNWLRRKAQNTGHPNP